MLAIGLGLNRVRKRLSLHKEDGQALVELALAIPLLLFIVFAIIDFGLAINQYNDATNLANLGARAAAVASSTSTNPTCVNGTTTSSDLGTYLRCIGAQDNGSLANVTVCARDTSGSSWNTGDTIKVQVSSTFNWMGVLSGGIGRVGGLGNLPSTISASADMRMEASNSGEPAWISGDTTTTGC
jgi:Flp pilus assembly protein TadG